MEFCVKLLSLPLWERGLKSFNTHKNPTSHHVAPLVGAWIEIPVSSACYHSRARGRSPCGSVD